MANKPKTTNVGSARVNGAVFNNVFNTSSQPAPAFSTPGPITIEDKLANVEQYSIPVNQFPMDNIVHVADVVLGVDGKWGFVNVNAAEEQSFKTHQAWVYFMTLDTYIVRLGETQAFLFDRNATSTSKVRINKYSGYADGSEQHSRNCLYNSLLAGRTVSFYAVALPITQHHVRIGNNSTQDAKSTKIVERQCFDTFTELTDCALPIINKTRI